MLPTDANLVVKAERVKVRRDGQTRSWRAEVPALVRGQLVKTIESDNWAYVLGEAQYEMARQVRDAREWLKNVEAARRWYYARPD